MRRLHPVGRAETADETGTYRRPDGSAESYTVHRRVDGGHVVRVEGEADDLWHLSLDPDGRPERIQVRLRDEGRRVDATVTFFEDEALVWRRGADPSSERVACPPGSRLLWAPMAGRGLALAGLVGAPDGRVEIGLVRVAPAPGSGLAVAAVGGRLRREAGGMMLDLDGAPSVRISLDERGRLLRWVESAGDGEDDQDRRGERLRRTLHEPERDSGGPGT